MNTGVLLSGGLDSAIALHWAKASRSSVTAWSIDLGQRHRARELAAAKAGADSIDGSSASRFALSLPRLQRAMAQEAMVFR